MNKLTAVGRVGADAEQRYLESGTALMTFPVAVDIGYGEKKSTQWYRCTIFGKRAEGKLVDYIKKGQQVVIEGEPKLNEYTTKDGDTKANIEVNVSDVVLVGSHPDQVEEKPVTQPAPAPAPQAQSFDDDVPF